jgi:hypothetical protein
MHVVLRPAGDQMFDTREWRALALVGGDGIEPPVRGDAFPFGCSTASRLLFEN